MLRLPTFARNQAGDWLMPSQGNRNTPVYKQLQGGAFFYDSIFEYFSGGHSIAPKTTSANAASASP